MVASSYPASFLVYCFIVSVVWGIVSVDALSCIRCSYFRDGNDVNDDCLRGVSANSVSVNNTEAICLVSGRYSPDKKLQQIERFTVSARLGLAPSPNCSMSFDGLGNTVYTVLCMCKEDLCNDQLVENCRCERRVAPTLPELETTPRIKSDRRVKSKMDTNERAEESPMLHMPAMQPMPMPAAVNGASLLLSSSLTSLMTLFALMSLTQLRVYANH